MNWDLTILRIRTEASWSLMRDRFHAEWNAACDTMMKQSRLNEKTWAFTGGSDQVNQHFFEHGKRMIRERWPDLEEAKE